jgi:hypothetical protein
MVPTRIERFSLMKVPNLLQIDYRVSYLKNERMNVIAERSQSMAVDDHLSVARPQMMFH